MRVPNVRRSSDCTWRTSASGFSFFCLGAASTAPPAPAGARPAVFHGALRQRRAPCRIGYPQHRARMPSDSLPSRSSAITSSSSDSSAADWHGAAALANALRGLLLGHGALLHQRAQPAASSTGFRSSRCRFSSALLSSAPPRHTRALLRDQIQPGKPRRTPSPLAAMMVYRPRCGKPEWGTARPPRRWNRQLAQLFRIKLLARLIRIGIDTSSESAVRVSVSSAMGPSAPPTRGQAADRFIFAHCSPPFQRRNSCAQRVVGARAAERLSYKLIGLP